jgi:hypothetical protein
MSHSRIFFLAGFCLIFASTQFGYAGEKEKRFRMVLNVARDCITDKEWDQAVEALQACLNEPKEILIVISMVNGKPIKASVHAEAERIIKSLPRAGREQYETQFGFESQLLLKAADKDEKKLQDLSRRFLYTKAGADGTERLAGGQFDAGRAKDATKTYARLLDARPLDKLSPPTLYKAARACRDASENGLRDAFWTELRRQAPVGFRDGDQFITHEAAERELQRPPAKP